MPAVEYIYCIQCVQRHDGCTLQITQAYLPAVPCKSHRHFYLLYPANHTGIFTCCTLQITQAYLPAVPCKSYRHLCHQYQFDNILAKQHCEVKSGPFYQFCFLIIMNHFVKVNYTLNIYSIISEWDIHF
jgi:hypothetical protein